MGTSVNTVCDIIIIMVLDFPLSVRSEVGNCPLNREPPQESMVYDRPQVDLHASIHYTTEELRN